MRAGPLRAPCPPASVGGGARVRGARAQEPARAAGQGSGQGARGCGLRLRGRPLPRHGRDEWGTCASALL
eukprot:8436149-Pyramimonas_sp.AAC.1